MFARDKEARARRRSCVGASSAPLPLPVPGRNRRLSARLSLRCGLVSAATSAVPSNARKGAAPTATNAQHSMANIAAGCMLLQSTEGQPGASTCGGVPLLSTCRRVCMSHLGSRGCTDRQCYVCRRTAKVRTLDSYCRPMACRDPGMAVHVRGASVARARRLGRGSRQCSRELLAKRVCTGPQCTTAHARLRCSDCAVPS